MDDAPTVKQKDRKIGENKTNRRYGGPRQSEVMKQVKQEDVVAKIMSAPVTVTVKEALATSKNVSDAVRELLQLKTAPAIAPQDVSCIMIILIHPTFRTIQITVQTQMMI